MKGEHQLPVAAPAAGSGSMTPRHIAGGDNELEPDLPPPRRAKKATNPSEPSGVLKPKPDSGDEDVPQPDLPPPTRMKKTDKPDRVLTPEEAKLQDDIAECRKLNGELLGHVKMCYPKAQRIGQLLAGFKEIAGRGNWLPWLRQHLPEISERTAEVYLRLWENRDVLDKFAAAADLSIRDALGLLTNGKPRAKRKKAAKRAQQEQEQHAEPATEECPEPAEPPPAPAEARAQEPEAEPEPEEPQPPPTEPKNAATEFLTDLFAKVKSLDAKRKLADHIADLVHVLVGEEATDVHHERAAPTVARGHKFCSISEAVENCREALHTIQTELENLAESLPENMESKRQFACEAAGEVAENTKKLEGLDLPDKAFAALPSLLTAGSRKTRLGRIAEILSGVAEALPECDVRTKLEEVADALENLEI